MMDKKEKRIIGFVVGLVILAGAIPSLMATPSGNTEIGAPAVKAQALQIPFLYLPSMQPIIIAGMLTAQQTGGSDTGTIIRIASEITILRPSGRD